MNRKELEAQMTSLLMPVAPHDWLIDRCLELLQQMLNEVEKAYPNISEPYVTSKEVDKYVISNVIRLIKERQPIA